MSLHQFVAHHKPEDHRFNMFTVVLNRQNSHSIVCFSNKTLLSHRALSRSAAHPQHFRFPLLLLLLLLGCRVGSFAPPPVMECEALVFKRNKNNNDHENSFSSLSLNIIIKTRILL